MKKELKSGILSADCRRTVGGVNVIAVYRRVCVMYLNYILHVTCMMLWIGKHLSFNSLRTADFYAVSKICIFENNTTEFENRFETELKCKRKGI